jgi:hypothetical protein
MERARPIRHFLVRGWPIAGAAALILVTSVLPWFRTRFAVNEGWASRSASAWQASSWWGAAVLLCLLATAVGLAGAAQQPWALHPVTRWVAVALSGVATAATTMTWKAIPALDSGGHGFGWFSTETSTSNVGDIVRDHLVLVHHDGLTQDVTWGLYAGLAAMVLLTGLLVMGATRP